MHSLSRLKLRGSRLVDTEPGLLWLVAEDGSNWADGMGRVLAGLAARTADRDALVKSTESDFVWACHQLQIPPPQPINISLYQTYRRLKLELAFLVF